jgi:competence protein ComEA
VKNLFILALLTCGLAGCTQQQRSPEEIREKTADATARIKTDTKAVVAGIRDGLARDEKVDINSASKAKLMLLPGVDSAAADRVIANRPYSRPEDLVARRVISQAEYDQIKSQLEVKK